MSVTKGTFKKGDPRINRSGRPKEHHLKGKVSMELQNALITLLRLPKDKAVQRMQNNPTLLEITAYKYITEYPTEIVDRFCGRIPQKAEVTGENSGPVRITLDLSAD